MTFDELIKIDRTPFSEDLFDDLFYNSMNFGYYPADVFAMLLFSRYMQKFIEIHELNIYMPVLEYPYKNCKLYEGYDDEMETLAEYTYQSQELFEVVVTTNGYEAFAFPSNPCEWPGEVNGENAKETFENFVQELKREWPGISPVIEECREEIRESGYLECGTMIILQNKELGVFQEICKTYQHIVQSHLFTEKKAIESAIEDLEYPLFLSNICKKGYCNGNYYICFDFGSNGYEYLDFSCLNWNWIITTIVLHGLMEDFKKKLKRLLCEEEWEEAV